MQTNHTNKLVIDSESEIERELLVPEKKISTEATKSTQNKEKDILAWMGKRVKIYWEGEEKW